VTYFASWSSLVGITPFALWKWVPVHWADHGVLILSLGDSGLLGSFFMNIAFRYAPAAVVASFDYAAMLSARAPRLRSRFRQQVSASVPIPEEGACLHSAALLPLVSNHTEKQMFPTMHVR
jgi:hypothetical protein